MKDESYNAAGFVFPVHTEERRERQETQSIVSCGAYTRMKEQDEIPFSLAIPLCGRSWK